MFLVLALSACAAAPEEVVVEEPDTTEADIAAIREVVNTFYSTRMPEDLDAQMEIFADDAQVHRNGAGVLVGKEEIRSVFEWGFDRWDFDFTIDVRDVQVSGDLGYLINTFALARTEQNGEVNYYYGSAMWILQRQADSTWKITRYIWNNRPQEQV
jgi:uncharacterized protein (TIGR02246 family)